MAPAPRLVLIGGDGGRSGVPRHIAHLCEALGAWTDITVISDRDRGGYGFARALRHVEVPGLETGLDPHRAAAAARGLAGALQDIRPDLVWAHARMSLPLARWVMRRGDLGRLMTSYHGLPFGPGHGGLRSAASAVIDRAGLWLGPPQDLVFLTEEDLRAMPAGPMARHRTHVLPNCSWLGVGETGTGPRGAQKRLVMLTRDSRQKNLDLAARILAALPGDFTLALYGSGTDAPDLRARFAAALTPEALRRVHFGGPVEDVAGVLAGADGLLVTSRYEGLSIAMIEAMEAGLPVMSTLVGGTQALGRVHPLFGLISGEVRRDAAMIAEAVSWFRADPAAWSGRIRARWAMHFAPRPWAGRVNDLVRGVLERPR